MEALYDLLFLNLMIISAGIQAKLHESIIKNKIRVERFLLKNSNTIRSANTKTTLNPSKEGNK